MIQLLVYNNKCRYVGKIKYLDRLRKDTRIRAVGAFFSPAYRKRQWDGYVYYLTEQGGLFEPGHLPLILAKLKEYKKKVEVIDKREPFKYKHDITGLGGLEAHKYQLDSVKAVLENKVAGIRFQRGILAEATNAGKSLIAAMLFASLSSKRKGIFLVDSKDLFDQSLKDFEKFFPGEVGYVSSKKTKWNRFTICMVQTLGSRLQKQPEYRNNLAKQDVVILDEADKTVNRKDTIRILDTAYNATIRVALSGTPLLHRDKNKNMKLLGHFGPVLHRTTNKDLVDMGVSATPDIQIHIGNDTFTDKGDYQNEYKRGIIINRLRHRRVWKLVMKFAEKKRLPCLILFKNHKQAVSLMKRCPEKLSQKYNIETVHHKTINRKQIIERFRKGNIDILLGSMILERGMNMPLTKVLINASGGTSESRVLQIFGRILRSHKSKKKVYMVDFYDIGHYLRLHSVRRIRYYKQQKFKVQEIYKQNTIK